MTYLNLNVQSKIIVGLYNWLKGKIWWGCKKLWKDDIPDPSLSAAVRNGTSNWGQVTKQILIRTGVL